MLSLGQFPIGILGDQFAIRNAYDGNNRLQYIGYARPEYQTKDKGVWAIIELIYDGATTRIIRQSYANGEVAMDKTWSDRATYTY